METDIPIRASTKNEVLNLAAPAT